MTPIKTRALILKRQKTGETSLLITLLTQDFGLRQTLAKGAAKPPNPLAGILDLFHEIEVVLTPYRTSAKTYLKEARLIHSYSALHRDYLKLQLASYFAQLYFICLPHAHQASDLYELIQKAYHYLDHHPASLTLMQRFEMALLTHLGLAPTPGKGALQHFANVFGQNFHQIPEKRKKLLSTLQKIATMPSH
ncbi:MAG: DNA repair protein RecO [Verrucomicrobiia bacterium]